MDCLLYFLKGDKSISSKYWVSETCPLHPPLKSTPMLATLVSDTQKGLIRLGEDLASSYLLFPTRFVQIWVPVTGEGSREQETNQERSHCSHCSHWTITCQGTIIQATFPLFMLHVCTFDMKKWIEVQCPCEECLVTLTGAVNKMDEGEKRQKRSGVTQPFLGLSYASWWITTALQRAAECIWRMKT